MFFLRRSLASDSEPFSRVIALCDVLVTNRKSETPGEPWGKARVSVHEGERWPRACGASDRRRAASAPLEPRTRGAEAPRGAEAAALQAACSHRRPRALRGGGRPRSVPGPAGSAEPHGGGGAQQGRGVRSAPNVPLRRHRVPGRGPHPTAPLALQDRPSSQL